MRAHINRWLAGGVWREDTRVRRHRAFFPEGAGVALSCTHHAGCASWGQCRTLGSDASITCDASSAGVISVVRLSSCSGSPFAASMKSGRLAAGMPLDGKNFWYSDLPAAAGSGGERR
jgi:hypothetical protein